MGDYLLSLAKQVEYYRSDQHYLSYGKTITGCSASLLMLYLKGYFSRLFFKNDVLLPILERINQNSTQYFSLMICKHPNFRAVCRSPHWITEQNRLCINIYATGCTTLAWHTIQSSSIFHWFVFLLLVAELQFSKLFVCLIVWTGAIKFGDRPRRVSDMNM